MKLQLDTERLLLVPFDQDDVSLFLEINVDPFVRKFLWDDEKIDRKTSEEVIKQNLEHFRKDNYGLWKIYKTDINEIIGYTGLWYFFDEPQPQLIYALLEQFTRKGYAVEASQAVIDYAFSTLGFKYLIAATDEPHTESQNVAKRLGMKFNEKRLENEKSTLFYRIERE